MTDFMQWAALVFAGFLGAAEAPASVYSVRPLVGQSAGERSVIAIAECPGALVPVTKGSDWCRILADGCRPGKVWILDQTRRGPPLVAHQSDGENIPVPLWCKG